MSMKKGISLIADEPGITQQKSEAVRKFLLVADYTMGFAPDRGRASQYQPIQVEWKSLFKQGAQIEKSLEEKFFTLLYVEREQREVIEGYIPGQRLILVHGLPGTGKTVVSRKIWQEFKDRQDLQFIYVDIKALLGVADTSASVDFMTCFSRKVYDHLKRALVEVDGTILHKWFLYKIQHDDGYATFRESIYDLLQKPLTDAEEWEEALRQPGVEEKLRNLEVLPSLATLIGFLQTVRPIVLCLDNVDRLTLYQQRQIFETCIDLSNFAELPVILAIRDSNLRRITDSGALGDSLFLEKLERLKAVYVGLDNGRVAEEGQGSLGFSDAAISQLLQKRLDFLATHGAFDWLASASKELLQEEVRAPAEYLQHFQRVFRSISDTFVDNDIYRFCNCNIRSLLILYSNFIHELLLRPEPGYRLEALLPEGKEPDITRLRSYLYKWLILKGISFPDIERESGSVLRLGYGADFDVAYKILAYLYNLKGEANQVGILLPHLINDLSNFGMARDEIKGMVTRLAKDQNYSDSTTIWLDAHSVLAPDETARVFLMPSGRYYLERLVVSREFAFWNILLTELSEEDLNRLFRRKQLNYAHTLDDEYKLELIHRFARDVLIPKAAKEIETYRQGLQIPADWRDSNLAYFRSLLAVKGSLYVTRLLISTRASIEFAHISEQDKAKYDQKYNNLISEAQALEADISQRAG